MTFEQVVKDKYQITALESPLLHSFDISGLPNPFINTLRNLDYILIHSSDNPRTEDLATLRKLALKKVLDSIDSKAAQLPDVHIDELPQAFQKLTFTNKFRNAVRNIVHSWYQEWSKDKKQATQQFSSFLKSLKNFILK